MKETEGKVSKRLDVEKDSDISLNHSDWEKQGRDGTSSCPVQYWVGPRACCEAREPRLVSKESSPMFLGNKSALHVTSSEAQNTVTSFHGSCTVAGPVSYSLMLTTIFKRNQCKKSVLEGAVLRTVCLPQNRVMRASLEACF